MTPRNYASPIAMLFVTLIAAANFGCGGGGENPPPQISVSVTSSAQTIDENRSADISATVVNDTSNKGVTWSVSGSGCTDAACGALSNPTATSVIYTAPNKVTANLSVTVVATSVADTTKSASTPLQVVPPPSVTTTTRLSIKSDLQETALRQPVSSASGTQCLG